jgi:hypothetical protein
MMNTGARALSKSKTQRAEATTEAAEAEIGAAADAADLLTCQEHAATLTKKRAAAVAANKPNSVISIDGELLRARVAVEIAESKATASTAKHASAVAALRDAETAVTHAALAVIDAESITLAAKFTAALDHALALGAELGVLSERNLLHNVSMPPVPVEVTRALERLPQRNPYDIPVYEMRGGGGNGDAWRRRLAQLVADHEPIDVSVAA